MNLTRMREVNWVDKMVEYYKEYHLRITWGDQDLVNIYFHFSPGRNLFWYLMSINIYINTCEDHHYAQMQSFFSERVYVFPCEWNVRPDHCMYGLNCDSAGTNGASVLHGNREVFHNEKQLAFKAVYGAFLQV